jgi:predicted ABC-type ATPase
MPTLFVLGGANGVGKATWYDAVLFFPGTNDIAINKNRVKARVLEGSHAVSSEEGRNVAPNIKDDYKYILKNITKFGF